MAPPTNCSPPSLTLAPRAATTFWHEVKPGTLQFDLDLLLSLPKLEWNQLFNLRPAIQAPGCSVSEGPGPGASGGGGTAAGSGNSIDDYPIVEV